MKWQPIETAPKDGDGLILLYRPSDAKWAQVAPGKWSQNDFAKSPRPYWEIWLCIGSKIEARKWEPTYWMPLPEPPTAGNGSD